MTTYDILCLAELAIDEIGDTDKITDNPSSVILKKLQRFYGGIGGNFCASASIFNSKTSIIAYLGKDSEGLEYKEYLKVKGIDVSYLLENEWSFHSRCFIANENEKTRIFFYPGALIERPAKYLEYSKSLIDKINSKAVFCSSMNIELNTFYLQNSKCKLKAFAPAHNTSYISKEIFAKCLEKTDILFLNNHESLILEKLLGSSLFEIAKSFNIDILIRTLGGDGSEVIVDGKSTTVLPSKASRELDHTGAGDAFAGAFLANYVKTKDHIYSAKVASATASFVVEELGCQTNLPTLESLKTRVKENYNLDLR
jgi:ribokinase